MIRRDSGTSGTRPVPVVVVLWRGYLQYSPLTFCWSIEMSHLILRGKEGVAGKDGLTSVEQATSAAPRIMC